MFYLRLRINALIRNTKLSYIIAPVVLCWCLFYLQGCKDPLIEDNKLLTPDDDLNLAKDTLSVKVFSEFQEPVNSNGVGLGVLGSVSDPNFGNTFAGVYARCLLTTNNVYFGDNPELDSAFLMVQYAGVYGKFDQPVDISVYELNQDMSDSTAYKTNQSFAVKVPPIGTLNNFVVTKPDGTTVFTDSVRTMYGTLAPHLRIPLDHTFARDQLLRADTTTILKDNASFVNHFKGLYITTSTPTPGNGIAYLNLVSPLSAVILYYHNNTTDSLSFKFPISGITINHFDNVYTGTPVNTTVTIPNANGNEKFYVQAGAGVKSKIIIPDLDSLPKNIAINKAELIITQTDGDTTYPTPLALSLFRIDDAGNEQHFEDESITGYGGVKVVEVVNGVTYYRYRYNIKRYFQKLIRGVYPNHGFYIEAVSPNNNSERVVLSNSSTDKNYQVSLIVTYTKL